ncbi:MAG: DUF3108 domain-containing protein, partial [Deinococcus sp.]|nr:DUF3108 domain-containing protein [Deinococcus sp.]
MQGRYYGAPASILAVLLAFLPQGVALDQPGVEVLVFAAESAGIHLGTLTITTAYEGEVVRITQTIQPSGFLQLVLAPELEWETVLDARTLDLRSMRRHSRSRFHNEEVTATVEQGMVRQQLVNGQVITYALPPTGLTDDQGLTYRLRWGAFPERIYTLAGYGPVVTIGEQLGEQTVPGPDGPVLAQGFRFRSFLADGTPASPAGDTVSGWIQVAEPHLPLRLEFGGPLTISGWLIAVR